MQSPAKRSSCWGSSPGRAITELAYVGTTLTLTAAVLARAGVVQDRLVAELRRPAVIDPLTGLATRRVLDDATRIALTAAQARVGTALVIIDVDRFKAVNDTYGHGVEALTHVVRILTGRSRGHDVVARMGGDELAVLVPGCGYDAAMRRAEDFVAAVNTTPLLLPGGVTVPLSISAGAAHVPENAAGAGNLYSTADAALYAAKRSGRGRVERAPDPDPRTPLKAGSPGPP